MKSVSPVRIYILWHPGFDRPDLLAKSAESLTEEEKILAGRGYRLARQLYHWFRLETMEGIPVFFRSVNEPGRNTPRAIDDGCELNYIIPLVEANMVASPQWRSYVAKLLRPSELPADEPWPHHVLPVALDGVAYQMPAAMRDINFIRHGLSNNPDPGILIGQLTEVICRHLRDYQHGSSARGKQKSARAVPRKLRIFLSHAKADGTDEPVALKEYIQGQTQCEAFFDETDLASGFDFSRSLELAVQEDSAGLLVVQGDHYADRPWCRKEIRDFLRPRREKPVRSVTGDASASSVWFIPPVVVVQTMRGGRIARTIPELGHSPCLRWTGEGSSPRLVVTTLLREILLGLFYRMLATRIASAFTGYRSLIVNRTPDPVMVERIFCQAPKARRSAGLQVLHPGYGLSLLEREGLQAAFGNRVIFQSFAEIHSPSVVTAPSASDNGLTGKASHRASLAGKVNRP